jgi:hypothetical protein
MRGIQRSLVDHSRGQGPRSELLEFAVTSIALAAIVAVPCFCVTVLIMLGMVLRFCRELVEKKDADTKVLRDVAVLLRAFRAGPGSLLSTIAKILKRT